MAQILSDQSRTFNEYLLLPNLTSKNNIPNNVSLKSPLVRYRKGEESGLSLNIPCVSSIMQSVSNDSLAIELARNGGLSFIFHSQPIESQIEMVKTVKQYKAGFVKSDSNVKPDACLNDIISITKETGHSTIAVTEDGSSNGKLLGIVTSSDYRTNKDLMDKKVREIMTPFSKCIVGEKGITLSEANEIIWKKSKIEQIKMFKKNKK